MSGGPDEIGLTCTAEGADSRISCSLCCTDGALSVADGRDGRSASFFLSSVPPCTIICGEIDKAPLGRRVRTTGSEAGRECPGVRITLGVCVRSET